MRVTSNGYAHMTRKLLGLAKGKLVVALEGGYNEEMTATCAEAVIRVMLGEVPRDLNGPQRLKACTEDAIRKALAVQVGELLLLIPTVTVHALPFTLGEGGERGRTRGCTSYNPRLSLQTRQTHAGADESSPWQRVSGETAWCGAQSRYWPKLGDAAFIAAMDAHFASVKVSSDAQMLKEAQSILGLNNKGSEGSLKDYADRRSRRAPRTTPIAKPQPAAVRDLVSKTPAPEKTPKPTPAVVPLRVEAEAESSSPHMPVDGTPPLASHAISQLTQGGSPAESPASSSPACAAEALPSPPPEVVGNAAGVSEDRQAKEEMSALSDALAGLAVAAEPPAQ